MLAGHFRNQIEHDIGAGLSGVRPGMLCGLLLVLNLLANPGSYLPPQELSGGGKRKLRIGPLEHAANLLKVRKFAIRGANCFLQQLFIACGNYDCHGFRAAEEFAGDYNAVAHAWLFFHRGFEIFGVNVHAAAGHDDVAFSSQEFEFAVFVLDTQIPGGQPFALSGTKLTA
jgi:hypothetical protein